MKTTKHILLGLSLLLSITFINAQQLYQVHQDNVKPSKAAEYEEVAKAFREACVKHKIQASWSTAMRNDFTYYYITPIENFAELDERPFADMAKAMGDEFGEMFQRFDKCYDSHGTYILRSADDLSYKAPEGTDMSDQNYRKWYLMHYKPKNAAKVKEGMQAVKDLFVAKSSKEYYNVYHSGFGSLDSYYLVSVPAKDELQAAQNAKANETLLGPERYETFNKVLNYIDRMEEHSGWMRTDLHYSPE